MSPEVEVVDDPRGATRRLTAADLMTPSPRTCSPFSTVTEAALIFRDEDCGAVPVLEDGKPVGLLTDRDVALAAAEYPDLPDRPVSDLMSQGVVTVPADLPLEQVEAKFGEAAVRRLLVVDAKGQLLGIVAWADLVAHLPEGEVGQVVAEVIERPQAAGVETPSPEGQGPPQPSGDQERARSSDRSPWADPRALWGLLRQASREWMEDKAPRLGAALAYYTIFSLTPLLLIAIAIAGLVFRKEAAQGQIIGQIRNLIGPQGAQAIEAMLASAGRPGSGYTATGIGVVLLLVGSMGLFGQLQDAMNTVWEVQPKPGRGLLGLLRDRLLSLGMVMGTVFLLLVSLIVSAALASLESLFGDWLASRVGQVVNFVVSFGIITGLFAMIYRFLPDAKVAWRDVWLGAAITSLLFAIGKTLIGLYIGHSSVASAYGAAGSLVVLLIWTYYSAQIFLFGAELTQAYADRFGSRIVPGEDAEPVTPKARAEQGMVRRGEGATTGEGQRASAS